MSATPIRVVLICDQSYDTLPLQGLANQSEQTIALSVALIPDEADDWPLDAADVVILDLSGVLKRSIRPTELCDTLYSHIPVILVGESRDGEKALEGIRAGAQDWLIQDQLTKRPLLDVLEFAKHEFFRQRDLTVSQAQYQSVVEDQTHFICRFLPDDAFTLTFVNQAYASKFGQTASALEGQSLLELTPCSDRLLFQHKVAALTPDFPIISYDRQMLIDGDIHWMHWSDRAIFDSNGVMLELQSVGTDISTLRSTAVPLVEKNSRFQFFFQNAPLIMQELDAKGRILAVNRCWSDATGYRSDEVRGKHFYRYMGKNVRHEVPSLLGTLIQQGWIKDQECQLVRCDGQLTNVMLSATAEIDSESNDHRFLIIAHEASQSEAIEQVMELAST